jgi:hypothetical protein
METTMRTAPFRARRAAARNAQDSDDDAWLEQVWACAERSGEDAAVDHLLTLLGDDQPPEDQEQRIAALAARAAAHHQAQAHALAADPDQAPDPALRLRELSALRYGVDPILSAAAIRVFAQRYPADAPLRRRPQPAVAQGDGAAKGGATPASSSLRSLASGQASVAAGAAADPAAEWLDLGRRIKPG